MAAAGPGEVQSRLDPGLARVDGAKVLYLLKGCLRKERAVLARVRHVESKSNHSSHSAASFIVSPGQSSPIPVTCQEDGGWACSAREFRGVHPARKL